MNIVSSTKLRSNLADALKMVKKGKYLLITQKGKLSKALIDIDDLEDFLELGDKKFLASVRESREQYKRGEYYTMDEVFGNI
jgi:prevent-host-death family protein